MNVLNEEVRAIQAELTMLRKKYKEDPYNKKLKIQILLLEKELNNRLEKLL